MKRAFRTALLALAFVLTYERENCAHAEVWLRRYSVDRAPEVTISAPRARVHVLASGSGGVEARIDSGARLLGTSGIDIEDRQTDSGIDIHVKDNSWRSRLWNSGPPLDFQVLVPSEAHVRIRVADGVISVAHLTGSLDLTSADGAQEVEDFNGTLSAQISDGDIRATGQMHGLNVNVNTGRLTLHALPGSTIASTWRINMASGDIVLGLATELSANLSLRCGSGGIQLKKPVTVQGQISGKSVTGVVNGGGGLVEANLGTGSIILTD